MKRTTGKYEFVAEMKNHFLSIQGKECLYSNYKYLSISGNEEIISFYLIDKSLNTPVGLIRFQIFDNEAYTANRAPFSSISIQDNVEFNVICRFIHFIYTYLKRLEIKKIVVKHFPSFYDPGQYENILNSFLFNEFSMLHEEINQHIPLSDNFNSIIHQMERRKLTKAYAHGLSVKSHENNTLEILFNTILEFRKQKNIPVNITIESLKQTFETFPVKYKFWSVSINNKIIACTVTVEPMKSVIYNFLPASDEKYKGLSPMVFLISKIFEKAKAEGNRVLDLGISSILGKPQPDLIKFKERIGGISSPKHTLYKVL